MSLDQRRCEQLIDKAGLDLLTSKLRGLELELVDMRKRLVEARRTTLLVHRIRNKLHALHILTDEDMEGLEAEFEKIPMQIRSLEADERTFITALPPNTI